MKQWCVLLLVLGSAGIARASVGIGVRGGWTFAGDGDGVLGVDVLGPKWFGESVRLFFSAGLYDGHADADRTEVGGLVYDDRERSSGSYWKLGVLYYPWPDLYVGGGFGALDREWKVSRKVSRPGGSPPIYEPVSSERQTDSDTSALYWITVGKEFRITDSTILVLEAEYDWSDDFRGAGGDGFAAFVGYRWEF